MASIRSLSTINPVSTIVLDQFELNSPIFRDIDAYIAPGNSESLKKHRGGKEMSSIFRDINEEPIRDKTTIDDVTEPKKIVSGHTDIDVVYEQRNVDPLTELEFQTREDAQVDAKKFHEKVWEADPAVSAKEFKGIKTLVPAARKDTISGGLLLPIGGDASKAAQQAFFEKFIQMQSVMPYSVFDCYMTEAFRLRILTAAKNLGYYDRIQEPDGVIERIGKANIKGYGYGADGKPLYPTIDGSGDPDPNGTTHFTFVRWGERTNLTFATSAGIVAEFNGLVNKQFYRNSYSLDGTFLLQNDNALYEIDGFKLAEA